MKIHWYSLQTGRLSPITAPVGWSVGDYDKEIILWAEIEHPDRDTLKAFLSPLRMHPLQLERCLDNDIDPGVLTVGDTVLMEYPAALGKESTEQNFLTILLHSNILVTVRHGGMTEMDTLVREMMAGNGLEMPHLPQIVYLILDHFADLNVETQINLRDQIQILSRTIVENPGKVSSAALTKLRWQVGNLIALIENQLYCTSRLAAADVKGLREPNRKAYIDDIVSEAEIARQAMYRLETRVSELFNDYQMAGSDRVEKRLRVLTIISAITLPLGLVAGLLGMNVGGVPGTQAPLGFLVVIVLMLVVGFIQYLYFKKNGWFD